MKLEGARVTVVGMARSGVAAAELLLEKGARVRAVDQNCITPPRLTELSISVEPQTEEAFTGADLIVLSPGVPADIPPAEAARQRGVKVIGDLELASWFLEGDTIGITGSNGKTTTTALTGHILQASGVAAQVGGNIGTPPCTLVNSSRGGQWNVLELSSFQLETTETFRARIGSALNVTPDHLDRHYTFERYAAAKSRLFVNQLGGDAAVLNAEDPIAAGYAGLTRASAFWFSSSKQVEPGAYLENGTLMLDGHALMEAPEIPLRGLHNVENTLAAAIFANLAGVPHAQIRTAVMSFPGVEHRIEMVRRRSGVDWYNDSKATNVDATLKAIAAFDGPLWIILGGKDKGSDYTPLIEPLRGKAKGVLLIGAAADKIAGQMGGALPLEQCGTLERAVAFCSQAAAPGDTVLLAPACASFDQFTSYEHRGREFKRLVRELSGE